MKTAIVWFRQDLRLADNPALSSALRAADRIVPLFIDDPLEQSVSRVGAASRVWLHHSLASLAASLAALGTELVFAQGEAGEVLDSAIVHFGASEVYWNRCYDPRTRERDSRIKAGLNGCDAHSCKGLLLFEPWEALKDDGTPYRVFTPFWKRVSSRLIDASGDVLDAPAALPGAPAPAAGRVDSARGDQATEADGCAAGSTGDRPAAFVRCTLDALKLLPARDWHRGMMQGWQPGEAGARLALRNFLDEHVRHYDTGRNLPDLAGTSSLSPHLHFGEISARQVLAALFGKRRSLQRLGTGEETWAKEIVWREFGYSQLFHFPHTIEQPLDSRFERFPWRSGSAADAELAAWQQGRTGIPIVDAGMRQLYATGWMHNRVRMIVASFLIKNLLIPWQSGERWFRDCLVDADLASNTLGWQWAAGSGADAAPFFRIFNPVLQGEKFDSEGGYVKRWVPELSDLGKRHIHQPWSLPAGERERLDYPPPLVDLKASRERALAAFQTLKQVDG